MLLILFYLIFLAIFIPTHISISIAVYKDAKSLTKPFIDQG